MDELPQLVNVLKGEMNFVGPRPVRPQEAKRYEEMHKKVLSVKPGIISPWHTYKRRYTLTFGERFRSEVEYIHKKSFGLDLKILCKAYQYCTGRRVVGNATYAIRKQRI